MTDVDAASADVVKARRGLIAALLGILLVVAAIAGVMYVTGIDPLALVGIAPADEVPIPDAAPTDSAETTATPAASPTTVPLPPVEAQEQMYFEQVASRQTIEELATDQFATFDLGPITVSGETADIRVTATYRDGASLSGSMLMRQYEGAWYFSKITRDGNPATTPASGTPDMAVATAMVEQQAANQEIPRAILDGDFTTMTINRVTTGSGTAMMDITLTGEGAREANGQITCIKKAVNNTTHWFITGFSRS